MLLTAITTTYPLTELGHWPDLFANELELGPKVLGRNASPELVDLATGLPSLAKLL